LAQFNNVKRSNPNQPFDHDHASRYVLSDALTFCYPPTVVAAAYGTSKDYDSCMLLNSAGRRAASALPT
jgi:hypothetical protein